MLHRLGKQTRNKGIETLTPQPLHRAQLRAAAQSGQRFQGFARIGKTALLQLTARRFFVLRLFPQRQPFTADHHFTFGAFILVGIGNHLGEVPGHTATPEHQLLVKGVPVGETEHKGNTRLILRTIRQHLGLAVGDRLNRVFGVTQKFVALAQLADHCRRQVALPLQRAQHL